MSTRRVARDTYRSIDSLVLHDLRSGCKLADCDREIPPNGLNGIGIEGPSKVEQALACGEAKHRKEAAIRQALAKVNLRQIRIGCDRGDLICQIILHEL